MNVLALDLSLTCIGWASNGETSGTHEPVGRGVHRLGGVLNWLDRMLLDTQADMVVLEGYSYASRGRAIVSLGELGGVVRLHLHQRGVPVVEVPPSCRAKLATGKGNAQKDAVLVEAVRRLGYQGHAHDEADALWLLQAALVHYGLPGAAELPKAHRDALAKVSWPDLAVA